MLPFGKLSSLALAALLSLTTLAGILGFAD